ncbi:MAG: polymerase [Parcubacteria group bacterium]|nr:polymerase [Parcubacteria group bacterium]
MKHILHVDGDSFFASVEASLDPSLKGRPVVTGEERGIATAMSKEAKALGVSRGMPVFQIKKAFPEVVIVRSDYHNYGIFAHRMYNIVRRYTPLVEEYSIDECFADLTGLEGPILPQVEALKATLQSELGMTFSFGVGPTKVLAKVASKWQKPDGLTVIEPQDIKAFLRDLPIGKVWGIGPETTRDIRSRGIETALQFIERPEEWIKANFARPILEIWHELRGEAMHKVNPGAHNETQSSIQQTRTFTPPITDKKRLLEELSKNVEGACQKARAQNVSAKRIYYFIKTQEFRYRRKEIVLVNPLSNPNDILKEIIRTFDEVFVSGIPYRATGVTLAGLVDDAHVQTDLFGASTRVDKWSEVFKAADKVDRRYGSNTIILGSSLQSGKFKNLRGSGQNRNPNALKHFRKRFNIPFMGEVS